MANNEISSVHIVLELVLYRSPEFRETKVDCR